MNDELRFTFSVIRNFVINAILKFPKFLFYLIFRLNAYLSVPIS